MTQTIFEDWFHKEFVPTVRAHFRSKNLSQTAVLFLDNAPSHPNAATLKSSDGQILVEYLPPNVTSLLQPMKQGVLEAIKRRFRKLLLRRVLEEDGDLKQFYKKWSMAILTSADSWNDIQEIAIKRPWNKLYLADMDEILKNVEVKF